MKVLLLAVLAAGVAAAGMSADVTNEITPENVLLLMNAYRIEAGVPPLSGDARLMNAAVDRMHDMEEQVYWSHRSPDGVSPFLWLDRREYAFAAAGENLATGFETARLLVAAWMESPGHRKNILSPNYQHCGIAIIDGATTGPAIGKSVVVLFARERVAVQMASEELD